MTIHANILYKKNYTRILFNCLTLVRCKTIGVGKLDANDKAKG